MYRFLGLLFFFSLILDFQEAAEETSRSNEKGVIFHAGNATSSSRRLVQSNVQPKITITQGQYNNDVLGVSSLEIRFTVSDVLWKRIRCYLQGRPRSYYYYSSRVSILRRWKRCLSVVNITDLQRDGPYTFTVQGFPASKAGSVIASSQWIIDRTSPTTYLFPTCYQQCPKNHKTFRFSAEDTNGIEGYQCSLDYGPWFSCKSPYTVNVDDSNNTMIHKFQVRAIDQARNMRYSSSYHSWYSNNGSTVTREWSARTYHLRQTEYEPPLPTPIWRGMLFCLSPVLLVITLCLCRRVFGKDAK